MVKICYNCVKKLNISNPKTPTWLENHTFIKHGNIITMFSKKDVIKIINHNILLHETEQINEINNLIIELAVEKCAIIFKTIKINIDKNKIYNECAEYTRIFDIDEEMTYIYDFIKKDIITKISINIIQSINESEENMLYTMIDRLARGTKLTDETSYTFEWYYEQE